MALNPERIRQDFPILQRQLPGGRNLVYLDSAATSQKPQSVINAMSQYYELHNANIHRGVHTLAEESTTLYEGAREKVRNFINAASTREIIYTRNTTESINLVAQTWGRQNIQRGDHLLLTEMEHHSNLVPWQMLAVEKEAVLDFIPVTADGQLDLARLDDLLSLKPKLASFTHMSNVLGTINPVKELTAKLHAAGAVVLVDGAQAVPHLPVDVQDLDVDFYAFSAHKMCGPTGIGILYGKTSLLESMPPFMGGGDMIGKCFLRSFTPNVLPYKFEAGTPAIAEAVGLGAAVDYLSSVGMENVAAYEHEIISYALEALSEVRGLKVFGPTADKKGAAAAFLLEGLHPNDIAQILDSEGVAVRAGHHCAMPLHGVFDLPASTRASFYIYNTREEVDLLVKALHKAQKIFG
ncbi:MAG TPA: cysteine desulfurase [Bellilinea sp.]|nr:cysteine desulfurase [Bellilinea sp.]